MKGAHAHATGDVRQAGRERKGSKRRLEARAHAHLHPRGRVGRDVAAHVGALLLCAAAASRATALQEGAAGHGLGPSAQRGGRAEAEALQAPPHCCILMVSNDLLKGSPTSGGYRRCFLRTTADEQQPVVGVQLRDLGGRHWRVPARVGGREGWCRRGWPLIGAGGWAAPAPRSCCSYHHSNSQAQQPSTSSAWDGPACPA